MPDKTLREKIEEGAEEYRQRNFTGKGRNIVPIEVREGFLAGSEATLRLLAEAGGGEFPPRVELPERQIKHNTVMYQAKRCGTPPIHGIFEDTLMIPFISLSEHLALRAKDQIEIEHLGRDIWEHKRHFANVSLVWSKDIDAERKGHKRAENNYFLSVEARILAEEKLAKAMEALRSIASCQSIVDGDCPSVARKTIEEMK